MIQSDIDPEVLAKFKKEFFEEYNKANSVKKIVKKYGVYEDHTKEANENDEGLGIKTLDFKYAYIKDWYVSTLGHAENYASAMIRGESKKIMETIEHEIQAVEGFESEEEMIARMDLMLASLTEAGHNPNVILVGDWLDLYHLKEKEDFIGGQTFNGDDYHGKYKGADVFYLPSETTRHKVFVLDLHQIGKLKQMQVKGEEGVEVSLEVSQIDLETIDKWITEGADVIKKDGVQMTREEIDRHMGERVLLDIFQMIEFEVSDNTAGLYAGGTE